MPETLPDTTLSPSDLVAALRGPSPNYKRAEMDAVLARLDACEPALLAVLGEAAEDLDAFDELEGPSSFALIYALHLLARYRSEAAHEPLLELLRNPDDSYLGDAVTEDLAVWLHATAGGRVEGIEALVADRSVGEWVRSAAVRARALVGDGDPALRDATIAYLAGLLGDPAEPDGEPLLNAAAMALVDLGHAESAELVRDVIRRERIDSWVMRVGSVRSAIESSGPPGAHLARELGQYLPVDDPHRPLSRWAAFEENRRDDPALLAEWPDLDAPPAAKKPAQKKKKKRRKAVQKAKKKQRKRR